MTPGQAVGLPAVVVAFGLAAAVVIMAGIALARAGDQIATMTGLGGALVGTLLLAAATSLPEIATDMAAAANGNPDLAAGDVFGSSMANMAILAVIDLLHRGRVWPRASAEHARLAAIAIALTAIAVLAIIVPPGIAIGWIGIETIVLIVGYVLAARWMRRARSRRARHDGSGEIIAPTGWGLRDVVPGSLRGAILRFSLAAGLVLVSAPVVAWSAGDLADRSGVSDTFVGAALLAFTTSLPELVASVAAVRMAAYDLAVGNLFGSNAFNVLALCAADVAYLPGPILASVDLGQAVAGIGAILLMALALAAVVHGERTRLRQLEPDAVLLLVTYLLLLGAVLVATT